MDPSKLIPSLAGALLASGLCMPAAYGGSVDRHDLPVIGCVDGVVECFVDIAGVLNDPFGAHQAACAGVDACRLLGREPEDLLGPVDL